MIGTNFSPRIPAFPEFQGDPGANNFPFQFSIIQGVTGQVNPYSYLMQDFNVTGNIPVLGLGTPFPLSYGQKVFLQIYFDGNLNAVFGRIMGDNSWKNSTTTPIGAISGGSGVNVYPNELEFITKADMNVKQAALVQDSTAIKAYFTGAAAYYSSQLASGIISAPQYATLSASLAQETATFSALIGTYTSNFSTFFSNSPSSQKKLFKLRKMIAYTTLDMTSTIGGNIIVPADFSSASSGVAGNGGTYALTATNPPFNLVQCVSTDLMLVSYCYNNLPAKIAIPWTRPVYSYTLVNGNNEDITNYSPSGPANSS